MGFLSILRPEPKCGHGNIRGFCTACNYGDGDSPRRVARNATDLRMSVQKTRRRR